MKIIFLDGREGRGQELGFSCGIGPLAGLKLEVEVTFDGGEGELGQVGETTERFPARREVMMEWMMATWRGC